MGATSTRSMMPRSWGPPSSSSVDTSSSRSPGLDAGRVLEREVGPEQRLARWSATRRAPSGPANSSPIAGERSRSVAHWSGSSACAAASVRSGAGRSKRCSRTACTSVPRAAAELGGSGSRSITRKRNSCGHCRKSLARDGDRPGRDGGRSETAASTATSTASSTASSASVADGSVGGVLVEVLHCHVSSVGGGAHTADQRPTYSGPVSASTTPRTTILRLGDRPRGRRPDHPGPELAHRRGGADADLRPDDPRAGRGPRRAACTSSRSGFVVLLFASVLVHELAHGLMARARGQQPREFVLTLWGGHTAFGGATPTPASSALIAVVGPIANLVLAAGFLAVAQGVERTASSGCCVWSGCLTNAFVGLFNLVPGSAAGRRVPARGGRLGGHQEPAHGDRGGRVGGPRRRRRRVRVGAPAAAGAGPSAGDLRRRLGRAHRRVPLVGCLRGRRAAAAPRRRSA